jgi:hypothetical protein
MQNHSLDSGATAVTRVVLALIGPVVAALLISLWAALPAAADAPFRPALPLAALGIVSWLAGLRWYRLAGLGLRGHRPLYAGIGFAALPWLVFLVTRFFTVAISGFGSDQTGQLFVYLLLFEAFALQLWTFGLVFRAVADWRGPLTAAFAGGLLFGLAGFLIFQESFVQTVPSLLYFLVWGVLYGLIRLRTGSILGIVIVQAMHSLTSWDTLLPFATPAPNELHILYLITTLLYLLLIWRLWPKEEEDYRV